jgi:phosphate transport system substrate-binding protein
MKTFAAVLLMCGASTLTSAQTTFNGAGLTFVYPIMSKWASEYHKVNPNVQVNYQSIVSGGGIRQVPEGVVD